MKESEHRVAVLVGEEVVYEVNLTPSQLDDPAIRRLVLRAFQHAIRVATPGVTVKLETVACDPPRDA